MKQFLRVDEQGYYIEPVALQPITVDEEGNKYYFPEDYAVDILKLEKPIEISEEFIKDYGLPEANCRFPKESLVEELFPDGMYKPRWNGTEWVDEMTQEELDNKIQQARIDREREFLENPTEQMILGREVMETELQNLLLEQQIDLLSQQNALLANLVIDMELHMLEGENNHE